MEGITLRRSHEVNVEQMKMRYGRMLMFITLMIVSCSNPGPIPKRPQPTGGPCDYEKIAVLYTVSEVLENGYTVTIRAVGSKDQAKLVKSYTSKEIKIEQHEQLNLKVGETRQGTYTIMTSGTCSPNPQSVEIKPNVVVSVLH